MQFFINAILVQSHKEPDRPVVRRIRGTTIAAIVCESRKMDASRQRASNDKVLNGDLIANRNSSAKHKKGSVAENKRLFLPVPGGYSDTRDCSACQERASAFNLHVYSSIPRSPPRINSIVPMQPVRGEGISNHERAPGDIGATITGEKGVHSSCYPLISPPT